VEPRLTASLQLRQGSTDGLGGAAPRSSASFVPDGPWPRSLRRRSLNAPALSAGGEGPDPASDALCRANLPRGVSPASSWYQGWFFPPSRQRRRWSPIQSAFHRRRTPHPDARATGRWCFNMLARGEAERRRRFLQSFVSTIHEHSLGSTRTPMDPPRGRPRDVLRWSRNLHRTLPGGMATLPGARGAPKFAPRRPLLG